MPASLNRMQIFAQQESQREERGVCALCATAVLR